MTKLLTEIDSLAERFLPQNKVAEGGAGSGRKSSGASPRMKKVVKAQARVAGMRKKAVEKKAKGAQQKRKAEHKVQQARSTMTATRRPGGGFSYS